MTPPEFVQLVYAMRNAQKRYFKQRDNLEDCKALERQVDREIENSLKPRTPGLFDNEEGSK